MFSGHEIHWWIKTNAQTSKTHWFGNTAICLRFESKRDNNNIEITSI